MNKKVFKGVDLKENNQIYVGVSECQKMNI